MFGKKKSFQAPVNSFIGQHTVLSGSLQFRGGLHIDGTIEGDIFSDDEEALLVLSAAGRIHGEVHVANMVVDGTVEGNIYTSKHIQLAAHSKIHGDIYYNFLEMVGGAQINGNMIHQPVLQDPVALTHNQSVDTPSENGNILPPDSSHNDPHPEISESSS